MSEWRKGTTRTERLHAREKRLLQEPPRDPAKDASIVPAGIEWREAEKRPLGEHLMRNLAVASALVLCAVTLRQGAVPSLQGATEAIMTAVTSDTLLDDTLGKLSFVSSLFPEATLVFGEQRTTLDAPVSGGMIAHVWSEEEPYMAWRGGDSTVTSAISGEVIGVYHGNGGERLIQIMSGSGLSCLYGNLGEIALQVGDAVSEGDPVGTVKPGADCVLEVRRDGVSIDPAALMRP